MRTLFEKLLLEDVEEKLTPIHIDNQIEPKANVINNFNRLLIPELSDSVREYTQGSQNINRNLWAFKNKNSHIEPERAYAIHDIHKTLDESNPAHDDMSVYSGVRLNPQELVKESGGILHHPAFISSSISPSVGMGFSDPIETKLKDGSKGSVRHILKIRIRKGQKVGGYLGDKSQFANEREYLLKANQLLKIHPEHEEVSIKGYDGKEKSRVHIHHAIILEPHEYSDLGEHKEVQSHKKLQEVIDRGIPSDLVNNHIDNYISKKLGKDKYDDKEFVENFKLNPHQIDKVISKDYLHEELSHKQVLQPHHIDYLLNGEPYLNTLEGLSKQKNLKPQHVDRLLREEDYDINNGLLNNGSVLKGHHIDKLIDKHYLLHRQISKLPSLSKEHIDKIIDEGDGVSLDNLSSRDDLLSSHIDGLIKSKRPKVLENISNNDKLSVGQIDDILDKKEFNSGYNLASREHLEPHHIDKLIDRKDSRISNILSYRKDLSDNHISKLLENSKNDYNFVKSDLLRNINNNYKLKPEHIHKIFSNISGYNDVLLKHVLRKQVGNDIDKYIEHPYIRDNKQALREDYFKIIIRSPL